MTDSIDSNPKSVTSIVWDNWGIVELLATERENLRSKLIDTIKTTLEDEFGEKDLVDLATSEEPEVDEEVKPEPQESIKPEFHKKSNDRGLVMKYYLEITTRSDQEGVSSKMVSLGAISVDIPESKDGGLLIEVSAGLPQQRIFNRSLEDSRSHVREKIEKAAAGTIEENETDEMVNPEDFERAIGRNDLAKRIVNSPGYDSGKSEADNINRFIQDVIAVVRVYTQIPRWLAERD